MKILKFIISIPEYIAKGLVKFYRAIISPLLPHVCKFTPSCSNFMLEAIEHWGFAGIFIGIKRIFRCNPKSIGGTDRVPYNLKGDFKCLI